MKNLAWVLALALLLCACRKDKQEDYDSIAQTDRIQMEDCPLIG
jgi:hypothetical protein